MSFYDDMAAVAADLLGPAEIGASAGSIVLVRKTTTPAHPFASWTDPTETVQTETLKAQAFGVSAEWVGQPAPELPGAVIVASDRRVICAVPAMGYEVGDGIAIDGQAVTILRVDRIPAAGTTSALRFIVR